MEDVVIVGGGIVGVATALALQNDDVRVTIVEPDELGAGTAAGSAGYLSDGEIFPLANPGVVWSTPKMLLDPLGPLVVDPAYFPTLLPWGLRFLAASRSAHRQRGIAALASLNRTAIPDLAALAAGTDAAPLLHFDGGLLVCRTTHSLHNASKQIPVLTEHGIAAALLTRDDVRAMEPALTRDIAGALYFPSSARCADPRAFGAGLARRVLERGGSWVRSHAGALRPQSDGSWTVETPERSVRARRVVVAAGVWSRALMEPLGYRVPLEAERGYHLMLAHAGVQINRPIVFEEEHFCATPMNAGLRLAGTVEFAGLRKPMNPRRSDILFDLASRYVPGLQRDRAERWAGFRPSFPDALPAIGRAANHPNLFYCFGHQHLGLTQAGITARCMASLASDRTPPIDLAPFDLRRFA